jgi:hypothetical protein
MRNSQRVVVGIIGLIALLIVAMAVWVRLAAPQLPGLSGERATRTYDFTNFDGVAVSGQWQVAIERGGSWRVAVDVPAELLDSVRVEQDGSRLSVRSESAVWFGGFDDDERSLEATITMPGLTSIQLSGASKLAFSGFEGDRLSLTSSGAAEVRGATGRYDTLELVMSGAGNVDLGNLVVTNANIQTSGAGNLELNMAGGRLTGSMSGAGNLEYRGTVSEQSVSTSGIVNIRPRN